MEKTLIQLVKSKVSIILPNYNSQEFIKKTIISILNQTYKNWELIFCDNQSKDNSKEIFDSFKNQIEHIEGNIAN